MSVAAPIRPEIEPEANFLNFKELSTPTFSSEEDALNTKANINYINVIYSKLGETSNIAQSKSFSLLASGAEYLQFNPLEKEAYSGVKNEFAALVKKWKKETGHFSVISKRYQHPAYKAILEMRGDVVPLILNELRRDPDRWFSALHELTGDNPAEGAENFYEAVDRWIAWGIANNRIK